jgi:hypothetical protein
MKTALSKEDRIKFENFREKQKPLKAMGEAGLKM